MSLGVDTYVGDPMCDLAVTTDGFARMRRGGRRASAARSSSLQEGGYADDALGANVAAWLRGARGR